MALLIPATADTPLKKYRFLMRVKRKLIAWQNVERAKLPAKLDAKQEEVFVAWEQTEWWPRMRKLQAVLGLFRRALHKKLVGTEEVLAEKAALLVDDAVAATEWDKDIGDLTKI